MKINEVFPGISVSKFPHDLKVSLISIINHDVMNCIWYLNNGSTKLLSTAEKND